jgi:hypothetical protein
MIINCIELKIDQKYLVAAKISRLSQEEGSSLLTKTSTEVLQMIKEGVVFAKIENSTPIFVVAFEPAPRHDYVEVGLVSNTSDGKFKGSQMFPEIINFYQSLFPEKKLYLTTTNIKMKRLGEKAGFIEINEINLPPEVIKFCCSPCQIEKTGAAKPGEQINYCRRFHGFIPPTENHLTNNPCLMMIKNF